MARKLTPEEFFEREMKAFLKLEKTKASPEELDHFMEVLKLKLLNYHTKWYIKQMGLDILYYGKEIKRIEKFLKKEELKIKRKK